MRTQKHVVLVVVLLCCFAASAKNKKKIILPVDVLQAQSIYVIIDPQAGIPVEGPNANRIARDNVERALLDWHRYVLAPDVSNADLVFVVRKGNGKMVQPTIGGMPNEGPVIFQPGSGRAGGSRGTPPGNDPSQVQPPHPTPEIETGPSQDLFAVYRGRRDSPLDASAVWRYIAKGALDAPSVPAVEEFKKLVVEAEKQQAANP